MKLYSLTDRDPDDRYAFGWNVAVWAPTESEAIAYAKTIYSGECHSSDELNIWCISETDDDFRFQPEKEGTNEECRASVLREAGWRDESDTLCDGCGLASLGYDEWAVCNECNLCPECAEEEESDCACKES